MPADTPDIMAPAWLGCISHAAGDSFMVRTFNSDTGGQWLENGQVRRDVDQEAFCKAFIEWANVHVWGTMENAEAAND